VVAHFVSHVRLPSVFIVSIAWCCDIAHVGSPLRRFDWIASTTDSETVVPDRVHIEVRRWY
jgi:hypothetical protein